MPLYEYRCTACGYSFEKIQSFMATPERVCPKCSGELIRPLSAPALQFKGSGWYINDYSSKGSASSSDSSDAKPTETAGKGTESTAASAAGSDSTPASTSAPTSATAPAASSAPAVGSSSSAS